MRRQWCVYRHVFPDGKSYIGITDDINERWGSGEGYKKQELYKTIKKFGWDNIRHEILKTNLSKDEANKQEKEFIEKFDSVSSGYNKTFGGAGRQIYYLSKPLQKFIRGCKKLKADNHPIIQHLVNISTIKEECEWWNEIYDYVNKIVPYRDGLSEIVEQILHLQGLLMVDEMLQEGRDLSKFDGQKLFLTMKHSHTWQFKPTWEQLKNMAVANDYSELIGA